MTLCGATCSCDIQPVLCERFQNLPESHQAPRQLHKNSPASDKVPWSMLLNPMCCVYLQARMRAGLCGPGRCGGHLGRRAGGHAGGALRKGQPIGSPPCMHARAMRCPVSCYCGMLAAFHSEGEFLFIFGRRRLQCSDGVMPTRRVQHKQVMWAIAVSEAEEQGGMRDTDMSRGLLHAGKVWLGDAKRNARGCG